MAETEYGFRIDGVARPYVLKPWIGEQYGSSKLRIIVHGDSYYVEKEGPNSFEGWCRLASDEPETLEKETCNHIESVIKAHRNPANIDKGSKNLRQAAMYSGIVKAILGRSTTLADDVAAVFGRIAFNNYVHVPMLNGSTGPTTGQFAMAKPVYLHELSTISPPPHLSLVFANRVWKHLPNTGRKARAAQVAEQSRDMWQYDLPHGPVLVGWLKHPSAKPWRFGWRDEIEIAFAQEYIRIARESHAIT